jgi:DNA polymerase-3 subunit delta
MFGGARWILVDSAGDETVPALEALLEAPAAGNPVALLAGSLKPASKLLKLALGAPSALAFASYTPDAREAGQLVLGMARAQGLIVRPDVASRIAEAAAATARSSTRSSPSSRSTPTPRRTAQAARP